MSLRDGYTGFKFFEIFPGGTYNESLTGAAGSASGVTLDTQGYETATFVINLGSVMNAADTSCMQITLAHADTDDSASMVFVSASDLFGSDILFNSAYVVSFGGEMRLGLTSASGVIIDTSFATASLASANSTFVFGYKGTKRYLKLMLDSIGANGGGSFTMCAVGIMGLPAGWPVNVAYP